MTKFLFFDFTIVISIFIVTMSKYHRDSEVKVNEREYKTRKKRIKYFINQNAFRENAKL